VGHQLGGDLVRQLERKPTGDCRSRDERASGDSSYSARVTTGTFVETPRRGVWVRRRARNIGFGLAYGALALLWIGFGAVVVATGDVAFANRIGAAATFLVPGSVVLKVALGCLRAGVLVTERGVVVRGPWTTRRFELAQVDRFEAHLQEELRGANPVGGVVLILRDGRRFSVWALAKESLASNNDSVAQGWTPTADALNALLAVPA
jgi:hypothetical protein